MFPTQHPVQDLDLGLDLDLIPVPDLEDVLPVAPMSIVTSILTTSAAATMALLNAVDIVRVCGNECIYSGICLIRSPPGHTCTYITDHITEEAVLQGRLILQRGILSARNWPLLSSMNYMVHIKLGVWLSGLNT